MSSPEPRVVRQLRHDVDDVVAQLLDATNSTLTTVASTQRRHGNRLEEIQNALDLQTGRLDRVEHTMREMLEILRRDDRK
jgi:hypothetical protein